jgi:hypothetical protein
MFWIDFGGAIGGVIVSAALLALLDPSLARHWLGRLTGHGDRKP